MYSDCVRETGTVCMRPGDKIMKSLMISLTSYSEDFDIVSVADPDPVRLRRGPLHLVDLPLGGVGQDGNFDGLWHLLDVPDQSLVVVGCI